MKKPPRFLIAVALCCAGSACLLAGGCAHRLVDDIAFPAPALSSNYPETLAVPLSGGDMGRLFVARHPEAPWDVLYFHGNGEDLGWTLPLLSEMQRVAGVNLFAADYRGYGASTGSASVETFEADALSFYDAAVQNGARPDRLIAFGYSIGGAAAVEVAAKRPLAGLFLNSTFTSLLGVPRIGKLMPFDYLRSQRKMSQIHCPVLIAHGTNDTLIDPIHAKRLHKAANPPKRLVWLEGENHNSAPGRAPQALREMLLWLLQLGEETKKPREEPGAKESF